MHTPRIVHTSILCLLLGLLGLRAELPQSVVSMKDGKIGFTVLAPDGVKPLADVELSLLTPEGSEPVTKVKTNAKGECEIEAKAGSYILVVGGVAVSQLTISPDAKTTHLRLVTPSAQTAAGAPPADAPKEEESDRKGGAFWKNGKTLTTALIIGGVIATGVIIYENNDDDDDKEPTAAEKRRAALLKAFPNATPTQIARFESISDEQFQAFLALPQDQQASFINRLVSPPRSNPKPPTPPKPKPISN